MADKFQIYNQLPYPLKKFAASTWGYYLRWWRYSSKTEKLVEEAIERESWNKEQWRRWQEERLAYILHRAATRVPYYREKWDQRRRGGDKSSIEILQNWPILDKEDLRANPHSFLADDCTSGRMYLEHTSGTTGKPVVQWFSRGTVQKWYAIYEVRIRGWNGVSRHDRWGILGGQLVIPVSRSSPPFWVWNRALNQLYLSSYHLSPQNIKNYIEAISRYKLVYLLGYTSALYSLAREGSAQNIQAPKLRAIICNAEPVYPNQKETLAAYFQCPVVKTYGMTEIVSAATECSHGNLHLFPDVGITEVVGVDHDDPLVDGQSGRLICTGLLNPDMPLIRYEVGDTGHILPRSEMCSCGRDMPILGSIDGRIDDLILTPDGRRIGRLDPVFKADLSIKEAQIIQEKLDYIRVLVIPDSGFTQESCASVINRVKERTGDSVRVEVEPVTEIPRTKAGKFKAVISKVSRS